MMFRLTYLAILLVFGLAGSCGDAPPAEAPAEAGSTAGSAVFDSMPQPGAPLFLVRTVNEMLGQRQQQRYFTLLLSADQAAYKRFPKGDWVNEPEAERLRERDAPNTGDWRLENNQLIIEWPDEPGMEPWTLTPWKNGYRRGQLGVYELAPAPTDSLLVGRYIYRAPDQIDRELYAVPGFPQITFDPQGRFSQNTRYSMMGQYQTSGEPEADAPYLQGAYTLDRHQLTLTFGNGLQRSVAVCLLPDRSDVLLIDGRTFVRYQPDQDSQ